jgi:hypothetical protein
VKRIVLLLSGVLLFLLAVRWDATSSDLNRLGGGGAATVIEYVSYGDNGWRRRLAAGRGAARPEGAADRHDTSMLELDLVNLMLMGIGLVGLTGLGGKRR